MKNTILVLCTLLLISSCDQKTDTTISNKTSEIKVDKKTEQLRHVVLFKFKESATSTDIEKVEAAFIALPSKIKEIKDFEWGLNNSPEGLNKGFTHCFFVTFDSEDDRSIYLPHPSHMAFVEVLGPHLEDVLVLDYWSK
tara:strand:- start:3004 stop:3420 length:417 start_codon:yes stop_codon:yes gene_type:complete